MILLLDKMTLKRNIITFTASLLSVLQAERATVGRKFRTNVKLMYWVNDRVFPGTRKVVKLENVSIGKSYNTYKLIMLEILSSSHSNNMFLGSIIRFYYKSTYEMEIIRPLKIQRTTFLQPKNI